MVPVRETKQRMDAAFIPEVLDVVFVLCAHTAHQSSDRFCILSSGWDPIHYAGACNNMLFLRCSLSYANIKSLNNKF